jgi:hypothetical protein
VGVKERTIDCCTNDTMERWMSEIRYLDTLDHCEEQNGSQQRSTEEEDGHAKARPWMGLRFTVGEVYIGKPSDPVGRIAQFESQRIPWSHVGVSGN